MLRIWFKIKDLLIKIYSGNAFVNYLVRFSIRLKNKKYKNYLNGHSPFEYKKIFLPIPLYHKELFVDNEYYSIAHSLKSYSGYEKIIKAYIEHGLYLGSIIRPYQKVCFSENMITFSENRRSHILNKIKRNIILIGPYIHYASDFLKLEDYEKIKSELGRVLLFFPSHSTNGVFSEFDYNYIFKEIDKYRSGFDTVLICLYWKDIEMGRASIYENRGYKVVCAGHFYDKNFLPRLKSIIRLADFTMSNDVGTHLGYCIYLKKPHFIMQQEVNRYEGNNVAIVEREKNQLDENDKVSLENEIGEISRSFSSFNYEISIDQYRIVDKYWGLSQIKSTQEMYDILDNLK